MIMSESTEIYLAHHLASLVDRAQIDRFAPTLIAQGIAWAVLGYEYSPELGYRFRLATDNGSGQTPWLPSTHPVELVAR
jgi:hypothetical protein